MAVREAGTKRGLAKLSEAAGAWFAEHPSVRWWLRVIQLGLFQLGMGISLAPVTGTLNRVLIGDLRIPAVAVGLLMAIHYFVSPIRALIGYRSDAARAEGRWRTPYIVAGAMLTYGGLATAPFSLVLLSHDSPIAFPIALAICLFIFLAYGIGVNIVETTYLALVSDITPQHERGRVLAVLWMMLVLGTIISSIAIGALLTTYSHFMLIRVMQGSAAIFIVLTVVSLLGRERLRPDGTLEGHDIEVRVRLSLRHSIGVLWRTPGLRGLFVVLFIATLAFAAHDVLLEPYGAQILGMSVTATTQLTALWGTSMLAAIAIGGLALWRQKSPALLIIAGCLLGALGFLVISLTTGPQLVNFFRLGVALIGAGRGVFIVGSVSLIMSLADSSHTGLFLGLWGVVQALAQGFGTVGSGLTRDVAQSQLSSVLYGYVLVYGGALVALLVSLALLLALRLRRRLADGSIRSPWAGLQDIPGDQILY